MPDGSVKLRGRVRAVLGDNIDTDIIYPGRYLNITDREKTAEHVFELAYPQIRESLQPGEFIVAARNFGCGSSREQAASALKYAGAGAVIAASFARIFLRNAINLGLPAVVSPEAALACSPGDELELDLTTGEIRNLTSDRIIASAALDARAVELLAAGGLIPYLKRGQTHFRASSSVAGRRGNAKNASVPFSIAWLPGDGIGPEVCDAARLVLDAAGFHARYLHGDIGWEFWRREGDALPARTVDLLASTDCAFFGAITSKPAADAARELAPALQGRGLVYRSPIIRLRQLLDLYLCLRPSVAFHGNPLNYREGIDLVVFRENTEGMYIGVEFPQVPESFRAEPTMQRIPPDAAISIRSVTRQASRRIVEAAFQYAVKHRRRKVTAVHKANVLRATCGIFLEEAHAVAERYPQIRFETANVDAMCMWLLKNPENYDVIVTTNLFGDILSDLCAQLVGGMGFAYSGNIGHGYAVFEPTHGSAPKYAGLHKVNPLAAILAAKMMAEWLGETEIARNIECAVARVIEQGMPRTYDMGGHATTMDMAHAVAALLSPHTPTEDLVNMRATVAQRIDCHGSKIEEMAGTGVLDTQGG